MVKTKTFGKRGVSTANTPRLKSGSRVKLRKGTGVKEINPTEQLLDEELIGKAIWECLKEGDGEGVVEVIQIYLEAVNKSQALEGSSLPRSTLYHALKRKNPTVRTLAKLVHACM